MTIAAVADGGGVDVGPLAVGLVTTLLASVAAYEMARRLGEGHDARSSPGVAMILMILNLLQFIGVALVLVAVFGGGSS